MNHAEAQQSHAAERYILNEMERGERERFEEHYFDCTICGADVIAGERMMASGRSIARETQAVVPFPRKRPWMTWLPLASAAMLGVVVGRLVMPMRSVPSMAVLEPSYIAAGESRAGSGPAITLRADAPNLLVVDVPPEPPFPRYEFQLRNAAGKTVQTDPVSAERIGEGVNLLLRSLPAGSYNLTIHGVRADGNRAVVATHAVRVQ